MNDIEPEHDHGSEQTREPLPSVLDRADVEAIVRLLGEAVTSSVSPLQKRRQILEGLAQLVGADVWAWARSRFPHDSPHGVALDMLDGGFQNSDERARFMQTAYHADVASAFNTPFLDGIQKTISTPEVIAADGDRGGLTLWQTQTGLKEMIITVYPLGDRNYSALGFHRRVGRPAFTARERGIVHVVISQLDFLHRDGIDVPANSDVLLQLSPRERQVLLFLFSGDSAKQIALNLDISPHTLNDYIKAIYRQMGVNSRAELLNLFMSGGRKTAK